jgi:PAS domain S-box-containing protein
MADGTGWEASLPADLDFISVLLDVSPTLVVILDAEGRVLRFNRACERTTGYALEEVKGELFGDLFVGPEEMGRFQAVLEELLAGRLANPQEGLWKTKQGDVRLITWSNTAIGDQSSAVKYVILTGIDITEHMKIEVALQQYQERLEEIVQERTSQLAGANAKLSEEIAERKRAEKELRRARRESEKRVFERTAELIRTNESLRHEILERRRADEELHKSEARLRAIATAVPDVLLMLDEDGRYIEILTSQPQLLYADPESLKGKLLTEVLSAHLAERFLGMIRQTLLTRQIQMAEYELQIAKVGRRYFEARMAPIEALVAGRRAVAVVARDITERRLTEEKLRHAQKMEAIGQLTGGIAHDFNNLLAIILANLELLDEQLDDRADLRDLIHRAFAAVDRGANLTQRLLAFSRRQPLQPKLTDLNALVAGMSDMLHRTLGETIEMQTVLAEGLLATRIDPGQFETALLNLVLNARDAMPRGGKLMITTANRWLDEDYARTQLYYVRTGQYVMLAVSDTGTGMAPEVLEHAFEPFFTTKAVGKGSGLGLSMVYGLVKQSGGYINIYSEIGKGTMVRIYLPWAQSEGLVLEDEEKAETVAPRGRAETILVVEDDPHVRQLAVSMLKNLGYHTVEADNARTALEVLDEQPLIVLLFTDLVLPGGVDGVELAKEARRRRPGLKVLFTTGYMESDRIESDLEHGAELLTKPYRKHSLASKLSAMLSES